MKRSQNAIVVHIVTQPQILRSLTPYNRTTGESDAGASVIVVLECLGLFPPDGRAGRSQFSSGVCRYT